MVGIPPIKMVMNGGWFMALLYQHYIPFLASQLRAWANALFVRNTAFALRCEIGCYKNTLRCWSCFIPCDFQFMWWFNMIYSSCAGWFSFIFCVKLSSIGEFFFLFSDGFDIFFLQLIGLREELQEHPMIFMGKSMVSWENPIFHGKNYRKIPFFMGKSMVSSRFS